MNKGSLTQFVKGRTAHRFPKVVTLAISSAVLVSMIAIDASASPSGIAPAITGVSGHGNVFATESSLSQLLGLGRHHPTPVRPTSPTTTTTTPSGSGGGSSGGGGGSGGGSGSGGGGGSTTTTTTTTTAPPSSGGSSSTSGGAITAGPSRSECLTADSSVAGNLSALQSTIASFDALTGSTVTCLGAYGSDQAWSDWTDPWFTGPSGSAYTSWIAADPQVRQMVLGISLIPASIADSSDPLGWEQSCASGDFNGYASQLGTNLVAAGLQNSVIRLGWEMNGSWEGDFMGTTTQEEGLWVTCFQNEVTALRSVPGQHFLIDWNPNSCTAAVPYADYYPGNAYVDIMGLDFYDQSCVNPNTAVTFSQLASVPSGLDSFEAFAAAQGKAMSFPEWGLLSTPAGDDPAYINGIGSAVNNGDFAFQQYFDEVVGNTILLGSSTPLSNAAYQQQFGNS
jgi:hypothetical protein